MQSTPWWTPESLGRRVEANNVVFLTLTRAKDFEKVGSGVWRYVGPDPREERA